MKTSTAATFLLVLALSSFCECLSLRDNQLQSRSPFLQVQSHHKVHSTEKATITDMLYRLDLVTCPVAKPVEDQITAYKTFIYYNFWMSNFVCFAYAQETLEQDISEQNNGDAIFEVDGYEGRVIQHFKYSCGPNGGDVIELSTNLPSRVDSGDTKLCLDTISITFNEDVQNPCGEFCGDNNFMSTNPNSGKTCLLTRFQNILITFRSGIESHASKGFKIIVRCRPTVQVAEEQDKCLHTNARLTTSEYFVLLSDDNKNQVTVKSIPVDAQQVLIQFIRERYSKPHVVSGKMELKMLKLALLCRHSCDEGLSSLADDVMSIFPKDAIMEMELKNNDDEYY